MRILYKRYFHSKFVNSAGSANLIGWLSILLLFFYCQTGLAQSPGGVSANLKFWVKANVGVTGTTNVSVWADQSGTGNNAVQATGAMQPALVTNDLNFNPSINFFGSASVMTLTAAPADLNSTVFAVGIPAINTNWRTMFRGSVNDHPILIQSGGTTLGFYDNVGGSNFNTSGFTWLQNEPAIVGLEMQSGNVNFRKNGSQGGAITTLNLSGVSLNYFGNHSAGTQNFGRISEALIYNSATPLTTTQKMSIESYLAVKYGLTLANDYLATNGTTTWSVSSNPTYSINITGIGRDDNTALDQRKSKSANTGGVLTIEKTAPASPFVSNLNFFLAGDDGASLGATTIGVPTAFPAYPMRVTRTWQAKLTGAPGTVNISFDLGTGIYNSGIAANYSLLVGTTNDFSAVTPITGGTIAGSTITFSGVSIADANYFTLGLPLVTAPGGVVNGLRVWLKADKGVFADAGGTVPATDGGAVQEWGDQTSLGNNATNTGTPVYNTTANLINYNPTVYYNGTSGHNLTYSSVNQNSLITISKMEGTQSFRAFSSRIGNTLLGYWNGQEDLLYLNNWLVPTGKPATTFPRMYAQTQATSGAWLFTRNGLTLGSGGVSTSSTIQLGIANGGSFSGEASKMYASEIIQYDHDITPVELNKVQSYLAVKYGISLDQTTPANYVASDGSLIWNATTNASYQNNIIGIGRDDGSALSQQKSKSANARAPLIIDKGGAFGSNKNFIITGDNNALLSPTKVGIFPGYPTRMTRVWRAQVIGAPGAISVSFDLGIGIYNSGITSDYAILIKNANNDFTSGALAYTTGASFSGSILTFTGLTFNDGDYFTLAMPNVPAPGGVVNALQLWLKGNQGVIGGATASAWNDQSGNAFNVKQPTVANQPTVVSSRVNFNPSLQFNGTNNNLTLAGGILGSTTTYADFNVFVISRVNTIQNASVFYEDASGGGRINAHIPWGDNNVYWDAGNAGVNRLAVNWGGLINTPYMWSLSSSTTGTASGSLQDIYRNGQRIAGDLTMNSFTGTNSTFNIGSLNNANFYNGEISEIIMYSGPISSTQSQQIQSYLALKYGITINQPTPQNYVSSGAGIIFHAATTHSLYSKDIAGIGRDDNSALDQRKSKSVNTPVDIMTMANGTFATPTAFSVDQQFLVWGNNGYPNSADAVSSLTQNGVAIQKRLGRIWSTDKNAAIAGNVVIEFNMNTIIGPTGAGTNTNTDVRMLIDGDGIFGNASAGELTLSPDAGFSATGGTIYFTIPYSNLPTGQGFVTIGSVNAVTCPLAGPSPGGVAAPMKLWLNANVGITGGVNAATWADQSSNAFSAIQATGANQPTVLTSRANFNNAVQFNGSTTNMTIPGGILGTNTYTDLSLFMIARTNVISAAQSFAENTSGSQFDAYTPYANSNVYWDAGNNSTNRVNVAWGGLINTPYLWTLDASTTATTSGALEDIYRNGQRLITGSTTNSFNGSNSTFYVGSGVNSNFYNGEISEYLLYTATLTPNQLQRVQSYLGVKYGVTINQAIPTNYLASNNTISWNATTNSGNASDITAIGRDDVSLLDQRTSKSVNPNTVMTLQKTTPASGFTNDLNFLVAGDDGGSLGASTIGVPTAFPIYPMRVTRIWKTQVTGTPGTVTVSFDLGNGIYNSGSASSYALLINTTNDFSAVTPITGGTLTGNTISFAGVNFNSGNYYTLALPFIPSPGGVINGLTVWLKSNVGVSSDAGGAVPATDLGAVQQWDDQTSLGNNATATGVPIYNSSNNLINFNPTVYYDGASGHNLNYAANQNSLITVSKLSGALNQRVFSSRIGNTILGDWSGKEDIFYLNGNPSLLTGTPATTNARMYAQTLSTSGTWLFNRNGLTLNSGSGAASTTIQLGIANGGGSPAEASKVYVSEVIEYNHDITLVELNKVQSYLAVKYGITLDQTSPANYVASDGTVIWNGTSNASYRSDIAGIGRDDGSALSQQKSASINPKASVQIDNGGTFAVNKSFIVWGSDNGALGLTNVGVFPGFPYRIARTWKTALSGTNGNVTISIDLSQGIYNSGNASTYKLLQKTTDINFSVGATGLSGTLSGNILTFTNVTLVNGGFFSLGVLNMPAPGGVVPNMQFWVKGNAGVTGTANVSNWADQSGGDDATQSVVAEQPALITSDVNYNPSINFSSTSSLMQLISAPTNLNSTVFTVAVPKVNTNWRTMFRGIANDHPLIIQSGGTALGYYDSKNVGFKSSGFTWLQNEVAAVELEMYSGAVSFRKNGTQGANINSINLAGLNLDYFGNYQSFSQNFGRIAETVIYNSTVALTPSQKARIETYLAVKYGITLTENYLASDASVIWNTASNTVYDNDITGVGRDDNSLLNQKQSASNNAGNILSISNGTGTLAVDNVSNVNNFAADKSFFIWGHNNLAVAGSHVVDFGTTTNGEVIKTRTARAWLSTETGTVGTVHLRFDLSAVNGPGGVPGTNDLSNVRLLMDADGVFASGAFSVAPISFNNGTGIAEFEVDFTAAKGFYFSIGSVDIISAPLPIELVSFDAAVKNEYVDVTWVTASELNNDYFLVQSSSDVETWRDVGRIKGHGTTANSNAYELKDSSPFDGVSYYRLKQIDFDGSETLSDIRMVDFKTGIKIYPNPTVRKRAKLEIPTPGSTIIISISDLVGQEVFHQVIAGSASSLTTDLLLDNLSPGEYIVRVLNGDVLVYRKIIVE